MERTYKFGEDEIKADGEMTAEQVRDVWMEVHPELENADIHQLDNGDVEFLVRAGTKG